jgi:arylsulfatase A
VGTLGKPVFKEGQLTLPAMLKAKGYETAAIGKWHLGWDWDTIRKPGTPKNSINPGDFDWTQPIPGGPLDRGFDHYFGDDVINFPPYGWIEGDKLLGVPDRMMDTSNWKAIKEGKWECRPGPMVSGWNPYDNVPETTRRGADFIRSRKKDDKPFFLYFSYPSPHAPIIPNDGFDGKSQAGPYGDSIYETDDSIGQLLSALDKSGLADNTLVIFSADNGAEHYAYARDASYGHWSSAPLRGLKRDLYEGGHRVPTLIRWPGVVPSASVSQALVSQIDIMATLAAVIDYILPQDAAVDSHNLLTVLKGEAHSVRFSHVHNTFKDHYAIREGDWVLIDDRNGYTNGRKQDVQAWEQRHKYSAEENEPVQLFNLKEDLEQKHNLAGAHPHKVAELRTLLTQIKQQGYSAPRFLH